MRLTLEKKIMLLSVLPLAAFVLAATQLSYEGWLRYQAAERISHNSRLFESTSLLIHEIQKERGISSLFLGGKVTADRLSDQRQAADKAAHAFEQQLASADDVEAAAVGKARDSVSEWKEARKLVDAKTEAKQVVQKFTGAIGALLLFETKAAHATRMDGLEAQMISVAELEVAKEHAGKLRATVAGALSADGPLDAATEDKIQECKSGVVGSLTSPLLQLSQEGEKRVSGFLTSSEWKEITQVCATMVSLRDKGHYGQDTERFFKTATVSIDALFAIISSELTSLRSNLDAAESAALRKITMLGSLALAGALGLLFILVRTGRSVSRSLETLADRLAKSAGSLTSVSEHIAESSAKLTEGGTDQASAVQQTVSAVTEVSATVMKNAENARSGQEYSDIGRKVALEGEEVVRQMIESIREIDQSNAEIMKQIEEGNQEIAGIARLIGEIGDKTKVINDIVFQTKLLSFNASVEAARAGEHGKGFAVVAEEVGNLAQMSGNAAQEIGRMLEDSTKKVESIIEATRSRVEALARAGQEKVAVGVQNANRCGEAIEEIRLSVERLNEMISQIAQASHEQSTAVGEISKAMDQLDSVVHKNNSVAQESAEVAVQLKGETGSMHEIVSELLVIVRGEEPREAVA